MMDTTFWPTDAQAARLTRTVRRSEDKQSLEEIHQDKGVTPALIEKLGPGTKIPAPILADIGGGQVAIYANRFAEPAGGLYSTASDRRTLRHDRWRAVATLRAVHESRGGDLWQAGVVSAIAECNDNESAEPSHYSPGQRQ
jgi:hypothetical protein